MNPGRDEPPAHVGRKRPDELVDTPPLPGQMALVMAGLVIGVIMMGVQLWLLTVALELYLGGQGGQVWQLALVSGAIFLGGLWMLWLLRRRPQVRRTTTPTGSRQDDEFHPAPDGRRE